MKFLRQIAKNIITRLHIISDCVDHCRLQCRYNASINMDEDICKMQYTLTRENHVLEKGMSMRNPRIGFGQDKARALLKHVKQYVDRKYAYLDREFLIYIFSTLRQYIAHTTSNGIEIPDIQEQCDELQMQAGVQSHELHDAAGVKNVTKEDIQARCNASFESLLYSRHSIRYFEKEAPSVDILNQALSLAQRTPSACNRQAWLSHVYFNEASHALLKQQGGCRGFEDEIQCSIVVTADLRGFLAYEIHQAFVDGGLYAMNLINALHSLGLGTIPLSFGFHHGKINRIKREFDIPENEVPIVIIGVGKLMDVFRIAESERKDVAKTEKMWQKQTHIIRHEYFND